MLGRDIQSEPVAFDNRVFSSTFPFFSMAWLWDLNLIRFFDFYLMLAFMVSTAMRLRQYEAIVRLVRGVPERWPRLLKLVKQHHAILLTWKTMLPAVVALGLSLLHMLVCRSVWPQATLTVDRLLQLTFAVPFVAISGITMFAIDLYATFRVGTIDRSLLETYFDQAEYWLRSWAAPVVHVFTLGYISPRRMVTVEVRKALVQASQLLNSTLWWVSVQVGLRIAFGLAVWLTYACSYR
jgi:hypothetical protein